MRSKNIVLAVVVLSVLAGLLTVGYAQSQAEEDSFEIRRWLIDRIEAAYTVGDIDTLRLMRFAALAIDSPEVDRLHPRDSSSDDPTSVVGASKTRKEGCWPDNAVGPPAPGQKRCSDEKKDAQQAERQVRRAAINYYRTHFRSLRPDPRVYDYCGAEITAMYRACVLSPGPSNRNRTQGLPTCTGATVTAQRCMKDTGYCPRCEPPPDPGAPDKPLHGGGLDQ
ncbi:MAG: hypothetical protein OXP74_07435 [Acidobacteriota bacterium]|nr:hypothetical protein [Acidobacteriota bacterium]MDE2850433.1 hypothetical protein [Acidobacteriota bacterium]MYA17216.1 hypothetical protein [Gammaproteobacteria bacterium]